MFEARSIKEYNQRQFPSTSRETPRRRPSVSLVYRNPVTIVFLHQVERLGWSLPVPDAGRTLRALKNL